MIVVVIVIDEVHCFCLALFVSFCFVFTWIGEIEKLWIVFCFYLFSSIKQSLFSCLLFLVFEGICVNQGSTFF